MPRNNEPVQALKNSNSKTFIPQMPKDKKRKRLEHEEHQRQPNHTNGTDIDTSKPSAVFQPAGGRTHTLSVAIPGSIIANAVSHDQKTFLAGTIARALAVFCVDEVVVFDDSAPSNIMNGSVHPDRSENLRKSADGVATKAAESTYTAFSDPSHFLAHLLSYLETPAYLRRSLFPMHPNLRTAGTLPSLDMPHHLRATEWCEYREGVTTATSERGTEIDGGLPQKLLLQDIQIPPGTRVTLKLDRDGSAAEAVSPIEPREKTGYYWGYSVRRCSGLSTVLTECPFDGGYDLSFGTSERGESLQEVLSHDLPKYKHLLLVFGGVAGLETAVKNDPELVKMGIGAHNVGEMFDQYVNVLPGQGSRTIRTEEAVWLGLMGVRGLVVKNG